LPSLEDKRRYSIRLEIDIGVSGMMPGGGRMRRGKCRATGEGAFTSLPILLLLGLNLSSSSGVMGTTDEGSDSSNVVACRKAIWTLSAPRVRTNDSAAECTVLRRLFMAGSEAALLRNGPFGDLIA